MVSGFAMPKIWRQIAMDISVTAVKTGRRRYLTLIMIPRFYVSTSKSIIKALINMHSFEIQLSPIG
ncbi:hypothetical protein CER21_17490 [Klebsiella pneumoniae subsp. pneumoniae]|nr:hypothetical protein CS372_02935 [Klebsiella pneumoniae]PJR22144.1 hypothetical protein CER21_17490 [Klebsiella pneumoniae subsp. pneumoniae]